MVMHACNFNTQEVKEGRSGVQGQPQQFNEFKTNLDFVRLHLKTAKQTKVQRKESF